MVFELFYLYVSKAWLSDNDSEKSFLFFYSEFRKKNITKDLRKTHLSCTIHINHVLKNIVLSRVFRNYSGSHSPGF